MSIHRVALSILVLAVLLALLAACTPPDPSIVIDQPPATDAPSTPEDTPARVDVFSIGSGPEAAGIAALSGIFQQQNAEVEINVQTAEGGDLRTRLAAGLPPDVWLARIGKEFFSTSVTVGQAEPLNHLYEQHGWAEVFSPDVMQWLGDDDSIYSVPVAIHRANILWYNPKVLEAAGVSPPNTLLRFPAALESLKAAGIEAPLVLGERWTAVHLFEVVMAAALGPQAYAGLWAGETDWESPEVIQAISDFALIVSYTNTDSIALDWQKAAQRVADGESAFFIMGDWVKAYFDEAGLQEGVDYAWTFAPGTATSFIFLADGFVQAAVAPHLSEGEAWLEAAASPAGQISFSRAVDALPARSDIAANRLNGFQRENLAAWNEGSRVGSMAHGLVITRAWRADIGGAMEEFLANRDVDAFHTNLLQACRRFGPCD